MKTSPSLALLILFWNIIHTSLINMTSFIQMCVFLFYKPNPNPNPGLAPITAYTLAITSLVRTVAQLHAGQVPHKTQVALDRDQMKWVRSKPGIENEAPNWLGANTNNPGGAKEEHSEACLPYVAGMRDEKQILSWLHVRKLLSLSYTELKWLY